MRKKEKLDTSMVRTHLGKHPEQFDFCPECRVVVPKKASKCWKCGHLLYLSKESEITDES